MLQEEGEFCRSPLLPQFPCGKGENRPCLTLRSSNIKKFRGGEGPRGGREMETHPDEPGQAEEPSLVQLRAPNTSLGTPCGEMGAGWPGPVPEGGSTGSCWKPGKLRHPRQHHQHHQHQGATSTSSACTPNLLTATTPIPNSPLASPQKGTRGSDALGGPRWRGAGAGHPERGRTLPRAAPNCGSAKCEPGGLSCYYPERNGGTIAVAAGAVRPGDKGPGRSAGKRGSRSRAQSGPEGAAPLGMRGLRGEERAWGGRNTQG